MSDPDLNHDPAQTGHDELVIAIGCQEVHAYFRDRHGKVVSWSRQMGMDRLFVEIQELVQRRFGLRIGDRTAEFMCMDLGSAVTVAGRETYTMDLKGRCLSEGIPRIVSVKDTDLDEAIQAFLDPLLRFVEEAGTDARGRRSDPLTTMRLCGLGDLLSGLDARLATALGLELDRESS
jgi:rod shape-determining protein MreB and related proteins